MKKIALLFVGAGILATTACHKSSSDDNSTTVTSKEVIEDFVNKTALPSYDALNAKALILQTAVNTYAATPNATNLEAARTAWRDVRSVWEQCEGFLVGPVSDDNYDPNMDTWPVDYNQLDSFISTSTSFTPETIGNLSQSLRGFHPLEYTLWGKGGAATTDSLSDKDKQYMVGLAQDVVSTTSELKGAWATSGGNYQAKFVSAGNGSTIYPKRLDAMLAIVAGMSDICGEVGAGKIKEPYVAYDSNLTESPFSHNSITDFTNNLIGARNVYLCSYGGTTGKSMSNFVSARNLSLDNKIKDQFAAAISAMGNVTATFEVAIHTQRTQLQAAMDAIMTLQETLDNDLKLYVQTYVTD